MLGITTQPTCFRLVPVVLTWTMAYSMLFMLSPDAVSAKSKPTKAPRHEPELKVLELKISPTPYTVSAGALEFSAVVQLPKELDGATILEVSSLVSSPSKTSIRFLSLRKPLESLGGDAGQHGAAEDLYRADVGWHGPHKDAGRSRNVPLRTPSQAPFKRRQRPAHAHGLLAQARNTGSAVDRQVLCDGLLP